MPRFLLAVLLALACIAPAGASTDCSPLASPNADDMRRIERIVRDMNREGLRDFDQRRLSEYLGDAAVSPLAEWYTRVLIATGAAGKPTPQTMSAARALKRTLSGRRGLELSNAVFVDDVVTTFGANDAQTIEQQLCTASVTRHWDPSADPSVLQGPAGSATPIDPLIVDWARSRVPALSVFQGVESTSKALALIEGPIYIDHPFNALTALAGKADFDLAPYNRAQNLPYFSDGQIVGVRLDSGDGSLSLYAFTGSNDAIAALHQNLDLARWTHLSQQFVPKMIFLGGVDLNLETSNGFDPRTNLVYGTQLYTPGLSNDIARETVALRIDRAGASLAILNGVAGRTPIHQLMHVSSDQFLTARPIVSLSAPMLYIVVDRPTGAILLVGAHISQSCYFGLSNCAG